MRELFKRHQQTCSEHDRKPQGQSFQQTQPHASEHATACNSKESSRGLTAQQTCPLHNNTQEEQSTSRGLTFSSAAKATMHQHARSKEQAEGSRSAQQQGPRWRSAAIVNCHTRCVPRLIHRLLQTAPGRCQPWSCQCGWAPHSLWSRHLAPCRIAVSWGAAQRAPGHGTITLS